VQWERIKAAQPYGRELNHKENIQCRGAFSQRPRPQAYRITAASPFARYRLSPRRAGAEPLDIGEQVQGGFAEERQIRKEEDDEGIEATGDNGEAKSGSPADGESRSYRNSASHTVVAPLPFLWGGALWLGAAHLPRKQVDYMRNDCEKDVVLQKRDVF
jgi:hypothetical protein